MEGDGGEGAVVDTVLIQVADVKLHGAVVLGRDQLVRPGAAKGMGVQTPGQSLHPCQVLVGLPAGMRRPGRGLHPPLQPARIAQACRVSQALGRDAVLLSATALRVMTP